VTVRLGSIITATSHSRDLYEPVVETKSPLAAAARALARL